MESTAKKPTVRYYYAVDHMAEEAVSLAIQEERRELIGPSASLSHYFMSAGSPNKLCSILSQNSDMAYIELNFGISSFKPDMLLALLTNDTTSPYYKRHHTGFWITASESFDDRYAKTPKDIVAKLRACITTEQEFEYKFSRTTIFEAAK